MAGASARRRSPESRPGLVRTAHAPSASVGAGCGFVSFVETRSRLVLQPSQARRVPRTDFPVADFSEDIDDFADTAALIDNLDLVITIDTSIAHLAGALGKKVWVLLKDVPDWRWLLDRTDSPWYPTMRLFRQATPGQWQTPIRQIVEELGALQSGCQITR